MRFPNPKGATLVLPLDGIVANGVRITSKLTSVELEDLSKEKSLAVAEMRVYGDRRTHGGPAQFLHQYDAFPDGAGAHRFDGMAGMVRAEIQLDQL